MGCELGFHKKFGGEIQFIQERKKEMGEFANRIDVQGGNVIKGKTFKRELRAEKGIFAQILSSFTRGRSRGGGMSGGEGRF